MVQAQWSAPATPARVSAMRGSVVDYATEHDVADPPIAALRLALAEAVSNAVVHAFDPGSPGEVTVRLEIDPNGKTATLTVADDGRGLAPRHDSPGAGFGLPLITACSDSVDIRRPASGRGTEITMGFALS